MTFHICGQCQFFERESHPEDEDQCGVCVGWEPAIVIIDNEVRMADRWVDCGRRACAIFKENRR